MTTETEEPEISTNNYEEVEVIGAAKRCGVQWTPWMGDWFTSWSPRNGNSNAEGTWDHWVELAIGILQHDFTKLVRPEVAVAVQDLELLKPYDQTGRSLTNAELLAHFGDKYAVRAVTTLSTTEVL